MSRRRGESTVATARDTCPGRETAPRLRPLSPKGRGVTRGASVLIVGLLLAAVLGCGGDPHGRLPLEGAVKFKGQPLEKGTIEFLATDAGNPLSARTLISDGKYSIAREQGLPPGVYKVLISSPEAGKGEPIGPLKMPPPGVERIPVKYNRDSKETVTVSSSSPNRFEFVID